jgi:hypothetical protein
MSELRSTRSIKTVGEALSYAEAAVVNFYPANSQRHRYADVIRELLRDVARQRPTGPDGKHGDRHTATCGCDIDDQAAADRHALVAEHLAAIAIVEKLNLELREGHPNYDTMRVCLRWMRQHIHQRTYQIAIGEAFMARIPTDHSDPAEIGRAVIAAVQGAGHTVTLNTEVAADE